MHSSLIVTLDGLHLGLSAIKLWARAKFKGTAALKKETNSAQMPSKRRGASAGGEHAPVDRVVRRSRAMLHIGDRERDIYEPFCTPRELGTLFLVRTCVDRVLASTRSPPR